MRGSNVRIWTYWKDYLTACGGSYKITVVYYFSVSIFLPFVEITVSAFPNVVLASCSSKSVIHTTSTLPYERSLVFRIG